MNVVVYSVLGNVCDRNSNQNGYGWSEGNASTLNTVDRHAVVYAAAFMGGQGEKAHGIGWSETITPTLKSTASGTNAVPDVVCPINTMVVTRGGKDDMRTCFGVGEANDPQFTLSAAHEHGVVYAIEGDGNTRAHIAKNLSPCMKTVHVNTVVYDARGNGNGDIAPTITGDHNNRVTDYIALSAGNGQANQLNMGNRAGALNCMHDQQIVIHSAPQPYRYIVRRLTPLECCRLQGYPDGWTEGMSIPEPSEEEISFWTAVWRDWAEINGKKPKSRSGVIKWLQNAGSDSAEYKAYGNSLAIPCANDVIRRIAEFARRE